jgi:Single-strand binding protein family
MTGLAEITLVGMLVTDPELSVSPAGAAVARFTVAATDGHYDPVTGKWGQGSDISALPDRVPGCGQRHRIPDQRRSQPSGATSSTASADCSGS